MSQNDLEKIYQPREIEPRITHFWEHNNFSAPHVAEKTYCIMLPPPNVTGTLHMGHGFQHTLMDALIRFHRMQGDNTLWQAGTDHAGIATQMVVERQLAQQNLSRHDLGRDAFLKKIWAWKQESGNKITQQMRRMGFSLDWSRERFTMDDNISRATMEAFIRLYNEGCIYRGKKLVNWDPHFKTAISDLEVNNEMAKGHLWYIRYPIANSDDFLVIATTRPETMLGDTAVAVHPEDARYQKYIGKQIALPLTNRFIPIITDTTVEKEFGTGCVKITPAHDFNDYALGLCHQLPIMNIMTLDAKLNENTPEAYRGLDRFIARKKIVADLESLGLLDKIEDHEHAIPRGDRSGVIIEPLLTDQWFVKMQAMADAAIDAYQNHAFEFVPENWGKTYLQWLSNIEDWCISRQLWWGHRIPVWYDTEGKQYVGLHEADVRQRHHLHPDVVLHQDNDVLDTWFSAALWPFATLGWPDNTADFQTFYPTSVLVTGFDIIFFWVARMVMFGLKFTNQVPFKQVYITGLIRDSQGQKMSKSKGNILDPIDLIDGITLPDLLKKRTQSLMQPQMEKTIRKQTEKEFPNGITESGTDALRFTFCALASTGRNINFDIARLTGYRNFCNKIWNAARFVMMNVDAVLDNNKRSIADEWILMRLQQTILQAREHFYQYRFDQLAKTLYEFIWHDYCDWYLELSKCDLTNPLISDTEKQGTKYTLLIVLENTMRLLHPIMPYITEEIWQKVAPMLAIQGESIMLQPYPIAEKITVDSHKAAPITGIQAIVTAIRTLRSEINISPAKKITVILNKGTPAEKLLIEQYQYYLFSLAKIEKMTWHNPNESIPESSTTIVNHLEIHVPLAGLIDKTAEISRLQKEIEKLEKSIIQMDNRLNNAAFIEKAPHNVVAELKTQVSNCQQTLQKLREQREKIHKGL